MTWCTYCIFFYRSPHWGQVGPSRGLGAVGCGFALEMPALFCTIFPVLFFFRFCCFSFSFDLKPVLHRGHDPYNAEFFVTTISAQAGVDSGISQWFPFFFIETPGRRCTGDVGRGEPHVIYTQATSLGFLSGQRTSDSLEIPSLAHLSPDETTMQNLPYFELEPETVRLFFLLTNLFHAWVGLEVALAGFWAGLGVSGAGRLGRRVDTLRERVSLGGLLSSTA